VERSPVSTSSKSDAVTAFDLDPAMIEKAQRRLRDRDEVVSLSVGDACEIEQPAVSIDAVVEFGVIHHVPDWQRSIGEIARVLRPGGLVLFEEVPRHTLNTWLFRTFTEQPRENRFEADEFADELARHGLQPTTAPERHFAGHAFGGAARKPR
jgi:ubiquinone/menaquinone biosynthesis C-methylase UbiE